jgi:hypothetical protein
VPAHRAPPCTRAFLSNLLGHEEQQLPEAAKTKKTYPAVVKYP